MREARVRCDSEPLLEEGRLEIRFLNPPPVSMNLSYYSKRSHFRRILFPFSTIRGHRMNLPDAPIAHEGFFATHFFTVKDQEKSKDFYVRILGGKVIVAENPCYIKLANTWIILNSGGGPTPDKPEVLLETPSDLNRVNSFLNLRVADIWACYKQWRDKGAVFLTEPLDNHGWEWRCYMRDPDGYLIEVGQYTQKSLDRFKNDVS